MKILLMGPTGQVGSALLSTLPALGTVVTAGRAQIDLTDAASIRNGLRTVRPDVIINAAAYTDVDAAEREEALAIKVNRDGPAVLASEAKTSRSLLVHFSTDYVFDGVKTSPYSETDQPRPLNAYGRSKLAGEQAIVASGCRHLILRTSWVYGAVGRNFALTIIRLAREGKALRVVDDQIGAPTSNLMISSALPQVIRDTVHDGTLEGTYHVSAGGRTSWYGFAVALLQEAKISAAVKPVSTREYNALAVRPRNSVLDNTKLWQRFRLRLPPWEEGMRHVAFGPPWPRAI